MAVGEELVRKAREPVHVVARMRLTVVAHFLGEKRRWTRLVAGQQIQQLDVVVRRHEYVLGPDIAVDDAFGVRIVQRVADPTQHREHLVVRERLPRVLIEHQANRRTFEELFAQEIFGAVPAELQQLDEVRVRPSVRVERQVLEALEQDRLRSDTRVELVQRDMMLDPDQRLG